MILKILKIHIYKILQRQVQQVQQQQVQQQQQQRQQAPQAHQQHRQQQQQQRPMQQQQQQSQQQLFANQAQTQIPAANANQITNQLLNLYQVRDIYRFFALNYLYFSNKLCNCSRRPISSR